MLVGKPVGAVVDEPSEARVLLCSSASVAVGGAVVVGAKVSWVGISTVVASLVPVGTMLWGASVVVGEGVVTGADSDSVGIGTGTTAVVDSAEDVAELALSVPLVIADSAEPGLVDDAEDSEAPVVDEASVVVDASDAAEVAVEVAVDASVAAEVVVAVSEAPEVVVDASETPEVADVLASVEVAVAAPDVASPDPVVLVPLSSPDVVIGTGTMGTVVLLSSEAVSVELLEETLDGLRVGASVDCSTAVAVDETSVAVAEVEIPVPIELSVALLVTGTGMAVVPSVPVDVLRL